MSFLLGFPIFRGYVKLWGGIHWGVSNMFVKQLDFLASDSFVLPDGVNVEVSLPGVFRRGERTLNEPRWKNERVLVTKVMSLI